MMRRLLLLTALTLGCGGTTPAPTETTETCSGTCDETSLLGPVVSTLLGEGQVAVVARGEPGVLLYGSTDIADGVWNSEGLHLRPAGTFPSEPFALVGGSRALLAAGSAGRMTISSVSAAGTEELASTDAADIERIALAEGWIAWTQPAGPPVIASWNAGAITPVATPLAKPSGRVALHVMAGVGFAAHGTLTGIELVQIGEPASVVVTDGETESHTLFSVDDTLWIAWADRRGVWTRTLTSGQLGNTRHVDDGAVSGEPAHRIGAGIAGGTVNGVPLLAYQDQTTGALVTSRLARRTLSQSHPSPDFSRGYSISTLSVGERLLVLDSALKVERNLSGTFFATVY